MFTVHYLREGVDNFRFRFGSDETKAEQVREMFNLGAYLPVAHVDCTSEETAYKLLQNGVVTDSWVLNPPANVKPLVAPHMHNGEAYGWRSMDIGDVLETADGKLHMVDRFGFLEIG